ncbi:MAG: aromatic ring-hydroxylating oxygenase subunit alpha [Acidimicrobiales bacterium]
MAVTQSRFVIDDRDTPRFRVHRSTMVADDVLEQERRLIFDRTWLYIGHESEIPDPHDFRTRNVGGRPVIFTRDGDGTVRVFLNTCPHRGMQIETRAEGHGRFLKCFYHGWSFNTGGDLVALPDDASYGPDFDRQNLCLARPPRLESYRGFVFLSWSPDGPDLDEHLGGVLDILDLFADQSDTGMRVIGGSHVYAIRANWKLLAENSYDGYHAMTTHHRYLAMLKESGKDMSLVFGGNGGKAALAWNLGRGHAVIGGADGTGGRNTGLGRDLPSEEALANQVARRDRFAARYGNDWADRMFASRNLVVFPNLAVIDLIMGITIRTFYPISPDYMEVTAWSLQPSDDDPVLREMRQENFLTFWGPAGLATPDDIEALERCQRGFIAHDLAPWNDISRGMVRDQPIFTDELQMRCFWREWDRLMTGTVHPDEAPVVPRAGRVGWPYPPRPEPAPGATRAEVG